MFGQKDEKTLTHYIVEADNGFQTRFIDTKIPDLVLNDDESLELRIRSFIKSNNNSYYLYVAEKNKVNGISLLIERDDVQAFIDAMSGQIHNYKYDMEYAPDYLENKFTADGLTIGYKLEKSDIRWFLKLETEKVFKVYSIKDIEKILKVFVGAKYKIKEIKKDYYYGQYKYNW